MTLDITATDMFCGAGGSTTGATFAGAKVQLAINHWPRAIETHNTNYPHVTHVLTDLHMANPRHFPSTTILVASPECTNHSLAKGRKRTGKQQPGLWEHDEPDLAAEAEERSRCTMWTPLDWAECHGYQAVILENVVDARRWRPFQAWLQAWRSLEYDVELVYFNSMFAHPTPQSRDRMYVVAWKRKNRRPQLTITPPAYCQTCGQDVAAVQSWKHHKRHYGKYRQQYVYRCPNPRCAAIVTPYYYAAANAIDWSLPSQRIGERAKPLREKTRQRIAYGLEKCARLAESDGATTVPPFLLALTHPDPRALEVEAHPFPTQTGYDEQAMVQPPSPSLPFLLDHLGEYRPRPITGPCSTMCASGNHHSLVVPPVWSWLMSYYRNGALASTVGPVPTVTTLPRHALVTSASAKNEPTTVDDCSFRMLAPKEIQAAMAFPAEYVVTGTRREQVKQLGNAVTPPVMQLLMERVIASLA